MYTDKQQIRYIKVIMLFCLVFAGSLFTIGCDDSLLLKEATENIDAQATLRISSYESTTFDIGKEEQPSVKYTFEYFDSGALNGGKVGDFLKDITFFISFNNHVRSIFKEEILLEKVPVSEMTVNELTKNLNYTLKLTLDSALDKLDLSPDMVGVNDQFTIDWDINLKDGKTLNPKCPHQPVGINTIPCDLNIEITRTLPENSFTGLYRFEQQDPGPLGMWLFSESFEAELTSNPDNILYGRTFKAKPYADNFSELDSISVPILYERNITISRFLGTGYECSNEAEVEIGPVPPSQQYEADLSDDSEFILVIEENALGLCGAESEVAVFSATKVE